MATRPKYSREQIAAAGKALADPKAPAASRESARVVFSNWRLAHGVPLNALAVRLRQYTRGLAVPLLGRRQKRLRAVEVKLERFAKTRLTLDEIQDIAGCRAVVGTCDDVYAVVSRFKNSTRSKCRLDSENDYIQEPKRSGYRSYHLIYRYFSTSVLNRSYDGMKVEIQVRTQLQHAWAAAVETVDLFTNQRLKTGGGDDPWRRFFALMGSYLAVCERKPLVPKTPTDLRALNAEIIELERTLSVVKKLGLWREITEKVLKPIPGATHFVLQIDTDTMTTLVYPCEGFSQASKLYSAKEKEMAGRPRVQVVQVRTDSIEETKAAYPSFYGDTGLFLEQLNLATLPGAPWIP